MLQATTLRGFEGGLNLVDDDMNLSFKFATTLNNVFIDSNGVPRVRQGTRQFADIVPFMSTPSSIVNMTYFSNSLVAVASNGEVFRIFGNGTIQRIFDATIAAALPDSPSAWSSTDFVSFEQFNGHLIICNGIDKPLDIDSAFVVEYLQDAATNTNINTPICKYVVAVGRYLVMAGDPLFPNRVHISARDAAGTWFGDPDPNDATRVDVGSVLNEATIIRGLLAFRGRVLVLYQEGTVVGTLGTYDENGNHEPNFDDAIQQHGSVSHRAAVAVGDDGRLCDLFGVPSIRRTAFSTSFKPERLSDLVDPALTDALTNLSTIALEDRVFNVYDATEGQYMLFVPNNSSLGDTTETLAFVHSFRPSLKQNAWSIFRGWNWTCGCRSLQGLIFFGDKNGKIWLLGSKREPITADYITMSNPTGNDITFAWEMPWLDFGMRQRSKSSKYLSMDTRGDGEFTVQMFCDNFQTPTLETGFSGGEQGLFGDGNQTFGGGRNTSYKKLYAWPAKFQIAKFRVSGATKQAIAWVSITLQYKLGSNRP